MQNWEGVLSRASRLAWEHISNLPRRLDIKPSARYNGAYRREPVSKANAYSHVVRQLIQVWR